MRTIHERLDLILPKIESSSFLENKGLGNEIGFYIFDYEPEHELLVREHISFLKDKLNTPTSTRKVAEFDLYQMLLTILEREGVLEEVAVMEEEEGSDYLLEALQDLANPEVYIKLMEEREKDYQVVFLTGVGKVWPVVRSHGILNNLHHVIEDVPVIMFFPGVYDGAELRLFNRLKDDNYYRAFPLIDKK